MMETRLRLVSSISTGCFLPFICCEVSSLIRNNAVWIIMTMDKEFCKYLHGSFDRNPSCREIQSIFIESVYFSQIKSTTPSIMEAQYAQLYDLVNQIASSTWWAAQDGGPWLSISSWLRLRPRPRAFSREETVFWEEDRHLFQNPQGLLYDSPLKPPNRIPICHCLFRYCWIIEVIELNWKSGAAGTCCRAFSCSGHYSKLAGFGSLSK